MPPAGSTIHNKSTITRSTIENSSSLRLLLVRADSIFRGRHWSVRQAAVVEASAVRVADLFVRRTVPFDGALLRVGVFDVNRMLRLHRRTALGAPDARRRPNS